MQLKVLLELLGPQVEAIKEVMVVLLILHILHNLDLDTPQEATLVAILLLIHILVPKEVIQEDKEVIQAIKEVIQLKLEDILVELEGILQMLEAILPMLAVTLEEILVTQGVTLEDTLVTLEVIHLIPEVKEASLVEIQCFLQATCLLDQELVDS